MTNGDRSPESNRVAAASLVFVDQEPDHVARAARFGRWERLIVAACCVLGCGVGAIYLGQDANWDQRNYHMYVVYAWLTGRGSIDVAPSQIQTWLNPLSHVPAYLLIQTTVPIVAGGVLGGLAGLNGLFLWDITRAVVGHGGGIRLVCAVCATLCGLTGSLFVSLLGTTFSENICSPLILAALVCLTPREGRLVPTSSQFFTSGVCLGAACGLKVTHLIYALGLGASLVVLWPMFRLRLSSVLMCMAGGAVGFLLVGGYWSVKMWMAFGNPVFPFFNALFRSPWYEPVNFANAAFLPSSFLHAAVTYPFVWLLGSHVTSEVPFQEPRFAVIAVLLPIALIVAAVRLLARDQSAERAAAGPAWFLWLGSLFFCFSYLVWMKQFAYQRYAVPLELLTGPILIISLYWMIQSVKETAVAAVLVVFSMMMLTRPADWYRVPYGDEWFGFGQIEQPSVPALYVMSGQQPSAYVIPHLAASHRFVRIAGNMPLDSGTRLGTRTARVIAQFNGPIRSLTIGELGNADRDHLRGFGLEVAPESCRSFRSRMDVFWSCELNRERVTR